MLGARVLGSASLDVACATRPPLGVYKPRRPHASPLFRLVSDHFCDACAHEYLLAFSCKARYFRPTLFDRHMSSS
jgi:hypothetical protein